MLEIVYSCNKKVLEGFELSCLSIAKVTKVPFRITLLTADLQEYIGPKGEGVVDSDLTQLRKCLKEYNPENEVRVYDCKELFEKHFLNSPNMNTSYTPYTLFRLFIDQIFDCDKVLYLDIDTMAVNSVEKFFEIDMEGKELAVVKDFMGRFWIKYNYFNAGVLLINLKECRKTNLFARSIEYLNAHKKLLADQDALNKLSKNRVYLSFDFNEQRKIKETTVIKHFCKGIKYFPYFYIYNIKQWDRENVHKKLKIHDFDDIYEEYDKNFKK